MRRVLNYCFALDLNFSLSIFFCFLSLIFRVECCKSHSNHHPHISAFASFYFFSHRFLRSTDNHPQSCFWVVQMAWSVLCWDLVVRACSAIISDCEQKEKKKTFLLSIGWLSFLFILAASVCSFAIPFHNWDFIGRKLFVYKLFPNDILLVQHIINGFVCVCMCLGA